MTNKKNSLSLPKKSIHRQIEWLAKQIKLQDVSLAAGLLDGRFTQANVEHRRACAASLMDTLTSFRDLMKTETARG